MIPRRVTSGHGRSDSDRQRTVWLGRLLHGDCARGGLAQQLRKAQRTAVITPRRSHLHALQRHPARHAQLQRGWLPALQQLRRRRHPPRRMPVLARRGERHHPGRLPRRAREGRNALHHLQPVSHLHQDDHQRGAHRSGLQRGLPARADVPKSVGRGGRQGSEGAAVWGLVGPSLFGSAHESAADIAEVEGPDEPGTVAPPRSARCGGQRNGPETANGTEIHGGCPSNGSAPKGRRRWDGVRLGLACEGLYNYRPT
jgi:hypothetical protein